jgi:hypothetical protein
MISRIKVIRGEWISDTIKRSWQERLFTLPFKPLIKYRLNSNAFFEGDDKCYVSPYTFSQLNGKEIHANVKQVHITELERVCGK